MAAAAADITYGTHEYQQKNHQARHHHSTNTTEDKSMPYHSSMTRGRDYLGSSAHSPVPSLTNDASRSSSVSSSVNSLSPDTLVTTPRDLMSQFKTTSSSTGREPNVGVDGLDGKKRPFPVDDNAVNGYSGVADAANNKRRRESSSDAGLVMMAEANKPSNASQVEVEQQQEKEKERKARRRDSGDQQQRRRRPLTGSVDFVTKFGLSGLYQEFVRPYVVGDSNGSDIKRQQLPDLTTAYLKNVKGSVQQQQQQQPNHEAGGGSVDLLGLVMAPPKNEFDSLDLLPMASIRAAFNIGTRSLPVSAGGESSGHRRSRISLKMSTDSQTPSPRQQQPQPQSQPHGLLK
ncbi:hypothetical protein H4217_004919, partial [Coemansia sp. RSA 1939]